MLKTKAWQRNQGNYEQPDSSKKSKEMLLQLSEKLNLQIFPIATIKFLTLLHI